MAIKDIFRVNRRTFFDPQAWLGYDYVKDETVTVLQLLKRVFTLKATPPERKETFAEAQKRLNLTDAEVEEVGSIYFMYTFLFGGFSFITLAAGFYLLVVFISLSGFFLALSLAVYLFSQAFRYHFWYFQIKYRKLGCTFKEWRQGRPDEK